VKLKDTGMVLRLTGRLTLLLCLNVFVLFAAFAQGNTDDRLRRALLLERESVNAQERGDLDLAIDRSRRAIILYKELGEHGSEAASLLFVGFLENSRKRFGEAVTSLKLSLAIYKTLRPEPPPAQVAEANFYLAESYVGLGRRDDAIRYLDAAPEWFRLVKNQQLMASGLEHLGLLEFKISRLPKAAALLEEALRLRREAGLPKEIALCLHNLAEISQLKGQFDKAFSLVQEAIRLSPGASDYETLGSIYRAKGKYSEALSAASQAESLFQAAGNQSGVWIARTSMAATLNAQGKLAEALALYQKAAEAFRSMGNDMDLPAALTGLGVLLHGQGRYDEARKALLEALEIRRRTGNRNGEAITLSNLAILDLSEGEYDRALARLEQSLSLRREVGDRQGEAVALINSAYVYADLGRMEEALTRLDRALTISKEIGERSMEAMSSQFLAQVFFSFGRSTEALERCRQALTIGREIGNRRVELSALRLQALLMLGLNQEHEALTVLSHAQTLSQELGDRAMEAEVSMLSGLALLRLGNEGDPRIPLRKALQIEDETKDLHTRQITLSALGAAEELLGHKKEAVEAYRQAIALDESIVERTRTDEIVASLVGGYAGNYCRLILLLSQMGEDREAFALAEQARARTFLWQIGRRRIDPLGSGDRGIAVEEGRVRDRLKDLEKQIRGEREKSFILQNRELIDSLAAEVDQARRQYETIVLRLEQTNPEYASLVHPKPLSLLQVQNLLPKDTTLIEYYIQDEGGFAWVADHDSYHWVKLSLPKQQLEREVDLLRAQIGDHSSATAPAAVLYVFLLSRLEEHIHHTKLIIVPHGVLHAVPFSALLGKDLRPFGERHSISILPSASVLPFLTGKRRPNRGRLLALGDPGGTLPYAAEEARAVARLYGTEPLLGNKATEGALRSRSKGMDILHVSAHATFDKARPMFSRIELAPGDGEDGHLEVHEAFNLDLAGTSLVVLSGCGTGLGNPTEGDDVVSFSRAFLYAGTPSVLATLWPVDDASSAALMGSFYRNLRQGRSPAEALQAAQVEIAKQERWKAPYYWAGYTLFGDGGVEVP
jgi:CHAT domain-containing protein/Tfp pilus assembly protein PilF